MTEPLLRIAGIAGSLRAKSFNRGLLRAAAAVAPEGVSLEIADIGALPLYNEDVRATGEPAAVVQLKDAVRRADAVLIATPEYNYSVPGPLKNAIDWLSRPPAESPLRRKPIALMGATTGNFGTVRAQLALRQILLFTRSLVLTEPEVLVARAPELFDAESNLKDEKTRDFVRALIVALVEWARLCNARPPAA
jgi:chromate reductase